MQIRDKRIPGYARVDNEVITDYCKRPCADGKILGLQGIGMYAILAMYAHNDTEACHPSLARLMADSGMSKPTVISILSRMEEVGLIEKNKRVSCAGDADNNEYFLLNLKGGSTEILPPSKPALPRSKATLPQVVKPVDHGSQTTLPQVVKPVDQGSTATLPQVVKPVDYGSKATLQELDLVDQTKETTLRATPSHSMPMGSIPPELKTDRYPLLSHLCHHLAATYQILCISDTGGFDFARYEGLLSEGTLHATALNDTFDGWLALKLAGSYFAGRLDSANAMRSWAHPIIKDLVADFAKEMKTRHAAMDHANKQRTERVNPTSNPAPPATLDNSNIYIPPMVTKAREVRQ